MPQTTRPGKYELLEFTYKEVLDATKHQDDKIGRLLTAIAFLTAASLAMANLADGRMLRAEYDIAPDPQPLGLFALTSFLIGVVITVVLLVTSFATPLRVPTLRRNAKTPLPDINWVNGIKGSQIYFSEIARLDLVAWATKWRAAAIRLERERTESLIRETHNLSVRTNFKYKRTSEAISVFSLAMLAFALAIIFTIFAATVPQTESGTIMVPISETLRTYLALLTAGYAALHLLTRYRYDNQGVDEALQWNNSRDIFSSLGKIALLASIPAFIFTILHLPPRTDAPVWLLLVISAFASVGFITGYFTRNKTRSSIQDNQADPNSSWWSRVTAKVKSPSAIVTYLAVSFLPSVAAICTLDSPYYAPQLIVGLATVSAPFLWSTAVPTLDTFRDREEFRKRLRNRN